MLNIGLSEAIVIFIVALIALGPEKLPETGKFLARLYLELRKSIEEIKKELEIEEIEKDFEKAKKEIEEIKTETVEPLKKSLSSNDKN
ncbi:MAG: twin-arginine translocase subunit TatB [Thermodesulfobacteriota bacterium]|nr:MAG: twin-arginine translocase subunit TatB [Thermodesulfobacteriota bacterium]RLG13035.1 MAG: twin-arginine translocase subunit TatB [Candidatus Pacearchaeota archaeon]